MTGRCVEGFVTGVAVGIGGALLGGVAYFVLTRSILRSSTEAHETRDPAETSALEASRNPTFPGRD